MRALRVCVGTNDGQNIASTHMGDTSFFHIYDITESGEFTFIEQRENVAKELDHAQSDKMKAILTLISDTQILVAQQRSPNFIKIAKQTKYQPVVVAATEIQAVLKSLFSEFDTLLSYVGKRELGEYFEIIPELKGY